MKSFNGLTEKRLNEILDKMKDVKAVLLGDMCLDMYWSCDMTKSVLSRETPHFPLPVTEERMAPGAGGNALSNMAALSKHVCAVGITGDDWRGFCLKKCFEERGINTEYIIEVAGRITNAYCKPMRKGYLGIEVEDPRIDFESFEKIDPKTEDTIIENLNKAVKNADVLCVSDQFDFGCVTDRVRDAVNEIAKGILTVVDSRSRIALYRNAFLKPNEIECARALNVESQELVRGENNFELLRAFSQKTSSAVCLTLGAKGVQVFKDGMLYESRGVSVTPPIDTCGAGDCYLSAFSLALKGGAEICEAAAIGNLASAVCVKKINTTGSATREEILSLFMGVAEDE